MIVDLPQEVDHYHELVPLEMLTLNRAVKSQTYGWITSTYKATHSTTGLRYCLKRIHGNNKYLLYIKPFWKLFKNILISKLFANFST